MAGKGLYANIHAKRTKAMGGGFMARRMGMM